LTCIWKAFGVVPLLYWPTSSHVTVRVLVALSKSYQIWLVPAELPPALGDSGPRSVSTPAPGHTARTIEPIVTQPSGSIVTCVTGAPLTVTLPPLKSLGNGRVTAAAAV